MVKETALDLGLDLTLSTVLSDFKQVHINIIRLNSDHWTQAATTNTPKQFSQALELQELYKSGDGILKCLCRRQQPPALFPQALFE